MRKVSLVVPVKNEEKTIKALIDSIGEQSSLPGEVVFVDGGSDDNTRSIIREKAREAPFEIKLVVAQKAYPGQARNIGVKESLHELVAFTDAGIRLDKKWLEELVRPIDENGDIDVVYGAFQPLSNSFIRECSLIAYIPAREKVRPGERLFRTNSIASSLFKRQVFDSVAPFPPFRAAEDKVFMDGVKKSGARIFHTDKAVVYWQIPESIKAIFKRFREYSAHDIAAGRARDWHYSVFRTYAAVLLLSLLGIFITPLFLWGIALLWTARIGRMFFKKREDFKLKFLLDPRYLFGIMFIVLVTDIALFYGSLKYTGVRHEKLK